MSGPLFLDRKMMTSTTTGTGTLTLGSAVTGYSAFPAAADGMRLHITAFEVDGSGIPNGAWESFVGVYTHSGTTLTRGVLKASSTGSAINFGATKYVSISAIAAGAMSTATGTDAAVTLVENTCLELDASILTADRILVLPAGSAIGDIVEIGISGSNTAFEAIIKTGTGETCAFAGGTDIASASEITRLFISGECLEFKKVSATKWRLRADGRIPMKGSMRLSSAASGEAAGTLTYPTAASGVWTAITNIGNCALVASDKLIARRAGKVSLSLSGRPSSVIADAKYFGAFLELNGAATTYIGTVFEQSVSANIITATSSTQSYPMAVDDYFRFQYWSEEGNRGLMAATMYTSCGMTEQLP